MKVAFKHLLLTALLLGVMPGAQVRAATVQGDAVVRHAPGSALSSSGNANVIVWLRRLDAAVVPNPGAFPRYTMVQHDKQFHPHVLAVPVGAAVIFPNQDPFFHNVFSLYRGEKFDLGLYEAGSSRTVRFDRAGVSFIFCNIHPEMSAYIIALDTPYFAASDTRGQFRIADVPPGRYRLHVWYERSESRQTDALARDVNITEPTVSLGTIEVKESERLVPQHTNKHGKPYDIDRTPY